MPCLRHALGCWLGLVLAGAAAAAPPDPLRLVPGQADLCVKLEKPRALLEAVLALDYVKQLPQLEAYREALNSTNVRLAEQFVAYFEKEMGVGRFDLLDRLAGGGAVLAVKFGPNPAPALLVVQSTDEAFLHKFLAIARAMAETELGRQESKDALVKDDYRGVETYHVGKNFHAAAVGSALLVSNFDKGLHAAIDLHLDGDAKSLARSAHVAEARKVLPPDPLVWAWLSFETLHKSPEAKEAFEQPRNNPQLTVLFGGLLDVARRAPFLAVGLFREEDGFRLTARMPSGRDGMPAELATHVPPADQPGSRPLLEPKGVLYSSSYYLDVGKFWEQRGKLFNAQQAKGLEEFDKNSGRFLAGNRLSQLLTDLGPYQRIVVTHQATRGYKTEPGQRIPAFALVVEMREPEKFTRAMNAVLRGVAFLASTQVNLKLVEEKQGEHAIVGYRFPEDAPFKNDPGNIRFNFSPCFVTVGNQFVACSTLELAHELTSLLEKEAASSGAKGSPAAAQSQFYAAGGAELLAGIQDQLFAQVFLEQAFPPDVARQQVQVLVELVRRLGVVRLEADYGPDDFRYDVQWKLAK